MAESNRRASLLGRRWRWPVKRQDDPPSRRAPESEGTPAINESPKMFGPNMWGWKLKRSVEGASREVRTDRSTSGGPCVTSCCR